MNYNVIYSASTEYYITSLNVSYDETSGETLLNWVSYCLVSSCLNVCVYYLP